MIFYEISCTPGITLIIEDNAKRGRGLEFVKLMIFDLIVAVFAV